MISNGNTPMEMAALALAAATNNAFEHALADSSNAALENELLALNANLSAATNRLLVLIRAFDRRVAWAEWGVRSMAHWLGWRCGIGLVAAREHVRWRMHWRNFPRQRPASLKGVSATRRYVP